MPTVLLIRHAENDYVKKGRLAGRLPGVHLNDKGRIQAQALAARLTGSAIKAIYSSPMERAMETAQPISRALGLDVIERPGLIEVDVGEWQDKKLKGLSRLKAWRKVQLAPSLMRFPGGETFAEAQQRICNEIVTLAGLHEPKEILACITHSDPIKLAVSYFIGQPLDLFQRFSVSPASITALYIGEMGAHLITLNYDLSFTLPKQ
jgi:probable phosphomutase (TIGR03848 family)